MLKPILAAAIAVAGVVAAVSVATCAPPPTAGDTRPPVVMLPGDIRTEATGPGGALVQFEVAAVDVVSGNVPVDCSLASGSLVAVGVTTVRCTASDAAGNTAAGIFMVTVLHADGPVMPLPPPIDAVVPGNDSASVSYTATAHDAVDGAVAVDCVPASGATLQPGTTSVECSSTDAAGNISAGAFNLDVAPMGEFAMATPTDLTVSTGGGDHIEVAFTASALDSTGVAPIVDCTIPRRVNLQVGRTDVSCSSTDAAGTTLDQTFAINVVAEVVESAVTPFAGRDVLVTRTAPHRPAHSAVVLLHGFQSTPSGITAALGADDAVLEHDVTVYAPNSIDQAWNAGICCGNHLNDDIGYLSQLVEHLRNDTGASKVYLFGFSNGGMLIRRYLATEGVEAVDGVVLDSATSIENYTPLTEVGAISIHGTADAVIPFGGGTGLGSLILGGAQFPPAAAQAATLATASGCTSMGSAPIRGGSQTVWACPGGVAHSFYALDGGEHTPHRIIDGRTLWQEAESHLGW